MKLRILLFLVLVTLMWVAGCGDDVVNNIEENSTDGRIIGSVHGIVTDFDTNEAVASVKVSWVSKGKIHTTSTDANGTYAITNLSPGTYGLTFKGASEYTAIHRTVDVGDLATLGIDSLPTNEDFHVSIHNDVNLYHYNATVSGTVYAKQDDENTIIAPNVIVIADFTNFNILGEDFRTTTDANGDYSFDSLPGVDNVVMLKTLPFSDATFDYSVADTNVTVISDGAVFAPPLIAGIATVKPMILTNNVLLDNFGLADNITLTFSKVMDTTSFTIVFSSANGDVEYVTTWTDGITLTIDPYVVLQASTNYTFTLTGGMSLDNNELGVQNLNFTTISGIQFVTTNLERVDGLYDEFAVASDITLEFDMEVDLANNDGWIFLTDDNSDMVLTDLSTSAGTVTINPKGSLEPGMDYKIDYKVYSNIEGDFDANNSLLFSTIESVTAPGAVTGFAIEDTSFHADWNTRDITFKWNTVAGARTYYIYAFDNKNNTDYVQIASEAANTMLSEQSKATQLPPSFDFHLPPTDATVTPFLAGTQVSYFIFASNDGGDGPMSTPMLNVTDETLPTATLVQTGSADNTAGTDPDTVFIALTSSGGEYLGSTVPTFSRVITGTPADTLDASTITFVWDLDMNSGTIIIPIPAGDNYAGSHDVFVNGFEDTNGNEVEINQVHEVL